MGPGQKFLTRVGSGQIFIGQDGLAICGLGLDLENFPLKCQIFHIFSLRVGSESTRVKGGSASYVLRLKSKLESGRVRAHLYKTSIHQKKMNTHENFILSKPSAFTLHS